MTDSRDDIPPEFRQIAAMLENERAQLTGLELDRVKRRVIQRRSRTTPAPGGSFMRSRLAIVATLAAGLLMSGGGAALGISAITSTDSASVAQYGQGVTPPPQGAPGGEVTPPRQEVLGREEAEEERPTRRERGVQRPRQVEAKGGGELPFTGYAAIPLLLVGIALLSTGLFLRRTT